MPAKAQERLDEHFLSLSRQRAGLGYPVYALEHGLDLTEVTSLRTTLARGLAREGALSSAYWLPWVVVAAEIGYEYDGDEYWNSFARTIPNWRLYGDRATIRRWFDLFAKRYGGFRPSGRWAQHFSIIAWPIAHAILPRDLQGQFARHLYDLRYDLARRSDASIEELGSIIQGSDPVGASRFQHFLGQTELTARLVLALRDEDVQDAIPAVLRSTLARIVADLEERRSARDWLREARTVLREARMRTSTALSYRGGGTAERAESEPEADGGVRLIARQSSEGAWVLGIKLPGFGQIIQRAGLPPKTLDQTRVRFADLPDRWMPGRALLTPREPIIWSLRKLGVESILDLERDVCGLSNLLAEALRIKGASPWLLRIQDDGVARQTLGNHVRAGQNYLIASDVPLAQEVIRDLHLQVISTNVEDAAVYFLAVPRTLGQAEFQALDAIKIGYALRANIEPMGLVPRWDGAAGRTVWLTTEELLLRLSADHSMREFTISVDRGAPTRITVGTPPEAIVSLGQLAIGSHVIEVGGLTTGTDGGRLEPERLEIEVRAPLPWEQGVRQQAGFRAIREPVDASLDSILGGKARLAVIGPSERQVALELRLFNLNGHLTESIALGAAPSLADEDALRRLVAKLGKEPLAEKVHAAPRFDLAFLVQELGVDSLSFSQKVRPFRWRLTVEDGDFRVRLIDEAGAEYPVTVKQYCISRPDVGVETDYAQCLGGHTVTSPGVLLAATCNDKNYAAIISVPPQHKLTLTDLGAPITVSPSIDAPKHIPKLLALLRLWGRAQQILGPLVVLRRAEVCEALEQRVAAIVCGTNWVNRMRGCRLAQVPALEQMQREIGASPGFGARLRRYDWQRTPDDPAALAEFSRLAATYQISDDPELCALALRLAFAPAAIKIDAPDKGVSNWGRLAQTPALAKGAFFARLVADLDEAGLSTVEAVCP